MEMIVDNENYLEKKLYPLRKILNETVQKKGILWLLVINIINPG